MPDWLFTWKGLLTGAVILLGAIVVGVLLRESTLGNVASIVGLAVSVLGFIVTIWTVRDARRQIQEASERAGQAIAQARQETRRAVEGIAVQLTAADCVALRHEVEDLRQAAHDLEWPRALYRCQGSQITVLRLTLDRHLNNQEATDLRQGVDDLQAVRRFIERYRLAGQTGSLQHSHIRALDRLIGLLARIQARLHHESLWAVRGPSQSH